MNHWQPNFRYEQLQRYIGWTAADADRVAQARPLLTPLIPELIDDFYAEIQRHPPAAAVMVDGAEQVERLKGTLRRWISELLAGPYDGDYVRRRAGVGLRHVEIGLAQVYTNMALGRLRIGMLSAIARAWSGSPADLLAVLLSLDKLLDLDLAVITAVYEHEHVRREQDQVRTKLEGVLHQQREFSEGLLSHAQTIVLVLDLQGRIVRVNPYVEKISGVSNAEAIGGDWLTLMIPSEDRPRARRELHENLLGNPTRPGIASTGLRADDHPRRSVRWTSTALRDAAGSPFALLLIGHDITDMEAAQQRALQAERLAAIGQMAAGLAHEARNALQRIQAAAEMLELEVHGQAAALEYVRRIEHAQAHLQQLFDDVRGYAAPVQLDRSPCRLATLWREAWELLAPQRRQRAAEVREFPGAADWEAMVDRFRLVQVFRNILENSLAAGELPLEITIHCRPATLGQRRGVCISVADNGPGLSPDQRRRIFEPFYTTKPKGTGLGMAIAQRWIEAHGGTIEVGPSTVGAEIILTLPLGE
ncbi:MAG: protoglobin domain-containing protein [Pirellulaceae bacterium]|nr:protoglobin domain-containing protein [Pirellulaceae bacterium]